MIANGGIHNLSVARRLAAKQRRRLRSQRACTSDIQVPTAAKRLLERCDWNFRGGLARAALCDEGLGSTATHHGRLDTEIPSNSSNTAAVRFRLAAAIGGGDSGGVVGAAVGRRKVGAAERRRLGRTR
jgi:hypothetical protein